VKSLYEDAFGRHESIEVRKCSVPDRRGLTRSFPDPVFYANLYTITDGDEADWFGLRDEFVEFYGSDVVREAENTPISNKHVIETRIAMAHLEAKVGVNNYDAFRWNNSR
jgi:hypothetical protein